MAEAKQRSKEQYRHEPIFDPLTENFTSKTSTETTTKTIYLPIGSNNGQKIHRLLSNPGIVYQLSELSKNFSVKVLFDLEPIKSTGALKQETLSNPNIKIAKLPHHPSNTKIKVQGGAQTQVKKWEIITTQLTVLDNRNPPVNIGLSIKNSVEKYNSRVKSLSFELLSQEEISKKLKEVLPILFKAVAVMPDLFTRPIPILSKDSNVKTLFLNQKQIASILANAFFCTFPKTNNPDLPEINFSELYAGSSQSEKAVKIEKLKCILHYFRRIEDKYSHGQGSVLSFERRVIKKPTIWQNSKESLSNVTVLVNKNIEDSSGNLQVDFANRFIGGGILGRGMVMEEIRFTICPELIAARLFTEKLENNEVLVITGCEQFSKYSGYGDSFKFLGNFEDSRPLDKLGRKQTQIVAMDAYHFREGESYKQFNSDLVERELNKCFVAFYPKYKDEENKPIATGNWGCGIFNGDLQLKFILQWISASQAKQRKIIYHASGEDQKKEIVNIVESLRHKNVGNIVRAIEQYNQDVIEKHQSHKGPKTLFKYLLKHFK